MDVPTNVPVAPARKSADAKPVKPRMKRRAKPGERALREIQTLQRSTKPILPRAPIQRIVSEVLQDVNVNLRVSAAAVDAIREMSDAMLTKNFKLANKLALDVGRRTTVTSADFKTAAAIAADCSSFVDAP